MFREFLVSSAGGKHCAYCSLIQRALELDLLVAQATRVGTDVGQDESSWNWASDYRQGNAATCFRRSIAQSVRGTVDLEMRFDWYFLFTNDTNFVYGSTFIFASVT